MTMVKPLTPEKLYRRCDASQFAFETTAEVESAIEIVGQARAVSAVRFGIGMKRDGYNLFALGPNGVGKHTAVSHFLSQQAATESTPPDWCYIYNFEQPHQPRALQLPAGQGVTLCQDMERLMDELLAVIPAAFESEEYQAQRQAVTEEIQQRQEESLEALSRRARERNIALMRTQSGLAFAPIRNGEVISPDEFMKLPEEEREDIQNEVIKLQEDLQKIILQVPQWSREGRNRLKALDQEIVSFTVTPLIEELRQKYAHHEEVLEYLTAVQKDVTENVDNFRPSQSDSPLPFMLPSGGDAGQGGRSAPFFNRYKVNLLVDNSQTEGAPVVYENNPTHQNLIGRVEHLAQMGALVTDFTLIKPGALHRANGGYLLLDVRKVLLQGYSWESLKRALQSRQVCIESLGQSLGLISTVSLEPEPIPLDVKVVLMGDRMLYYLLYQFDPELGELFKVTADFEDDMTRNEDNNTVYARLMAGLAQKDGLRPFHREAVSRLIEQSARMSGDAEKLTTHMQSVADLLREADYWAGESGHEVVTAADVQQAIDAQVYHNSRIRERIQESILRDTVLIDTDGAAVGQINGLAVLQVGSYAFGRPSRITARVRLGKGEVVDIERQVEMGGPIHSKGVMILSGFLGGRFAAERPLSLSASLVFEQSYSGVDGDSASSTELYALLSALAEAPLKQSLAVTGSVNQHGQVQAIGGVNEKIEGFFDICRHRGLTGEQGVLIPTANVKNLMLRQDVVEAVANGQFHVYAVETIDQGIELLTGIPAGTPDEEGNYSAGSINERVARRLAELAEKQRDFSQAQPGNSGNNLGESSGG